MTRTAWRAPLGKQRPEGREAVRVVEQGRQAELLMHARPRNVHSTNPRIPSLTARHAPGGPASPLIADSSPCPLSILDCPDLPRLCVPKHSSTTPHHVVAQHVEQWAQHKTELRERCQFAAPVWPPGKFAHLWPVGPLHRPGSPRQRLPARWRQRERLEGPDDWRGRAGGSH